MREIDDRAVNALAEAWASIDGHLEAYHRERAGNSETSSHPYEGRYDGYQAEAHEMINRLRERGFDVTPIR